MCANIFFIVFSCMSASKKKCPLYLPHVCGETETFRDGENVSGVCGEIQTFGKRLIDESVPPKQGVSRNGQQSLAL